MQQDRRNINTIAVTTMRADCSRDYISITSILLL